ncbi:MAG: YcxB family protein [Polyangiaceae bacterium]
MTSAEASEDALAADAAEATRGTVTGNVELTRDDVLEALHAQPGSRFKTAVGLAVSAAAIMVVAQSAPQNSDRPWPVIGLLLAAPLLARFGKRMVATRMFKGMPDAQRKMDIRVDDLGIEVRSAKALTRLRWQQIVTTKETPKVFLVYTSATAFLILPKRAFGTAGAPKVGSMLVKKSSNHGSAAKMWQPQLLLWALLGIAVAVIIMYIK